MLNHAFLIALKIERSQQFILDSSAFSLLCRSVRTVLKGLRNSLFIADCLVFIIYKVLVLEHGVDAGLSRGNL